MGHESELDSHRGYDRGSLQVAEVLAQRLKAPLLVGRVTRLLVDLNRSADHRQHFSEFTRRLPAAERHRLDLEYWHPHWGRYRMYLNTLPGRILHLACHSFVPVLEGRERHADIGLLYDPARKHEREWCGGLAARIRSHLPDLRVRRNYPYRGSSNGMGQQHRQFLPESRLISVELEINQALCDRGDWSSLLQELAEFVEQETLS
ncbi:N-formylglutamate amidohydrolase [Wenzhouxiangella sp. AB-CW3]|uniref:N-formylglutamate amidohydrolase n=1 Tax=Wenzhouxiangella sp. AB-CW3 TaxID=2771012 RepID=UPI0021DF5A14|nr:N-formylglutamate amidohydrolase [Wenzhouxiangella sp. AB-CW3]